MKKITTLLMIILIVSSCKLIDHKEDTDEKAKVAAAIKDSTMVNDKDENGCLASAGYVWSKVNKECVKGFSGIQLNPTDKQDNQDETLSAYVLFNEDASQAEIFLPKDTTSIVLSRAAEGKPWVLNEWQLVPWKGYVLKKGTVTMFSGDGEIGKKEIETDTEQ
ncbi:hypothetical protein L1S35_03965 [Flavobacterium sp. AS60]|uniref:hypothetical protein n=1 Tax=Flavobacterium anseongense TaxID=2910677 RepID=UPI001F35A3AD|nr:hypothetical protein [Flavobacterium sp. AS60]MCF6128814.1 hypothetical protein [Flavobacterium sp. AS60]